MARNTGAKHKLCRTVGYALCGLPKCPAHKRPYAPGQHGPTKRTKRSEYGTQLLEKQKLRYVYGVLEKQFSRYYEEAARRKGITGENLMNILETRLDNLVYRAGFVRTLPAARQLVTHGHITVNGNRVNIPSFTVRVGDVIGVTAKTREVPTVKENVENRVASVPYLAFDENAWTATLTRTPARDEIPVDINETLIVEFYSR